MKVSQLKILIEELKWKDKLEDKNHAFIKSLVWRLQELFESYDNEQDVISDMMIPVQEVLNAFWNWSVHHLPYTQWQNNELVTPWLSLQNKLVKEGLLKRDFHHSILYAELKERYDHVPGNQLSISDLMPLLIRASRMAGYAYVDELDNYPLVRMGQFFSLNHAHEVQKLKEILFLLQTCFYLLHSQCTTEQVQLIPYLIDFRSDTTDEERRSERAIVHTFNKKIAECLNFFRTQENYIDIRVLRTADVLTSVTHLIPTRRADFLHIIDDSRWIYHFLQKSRIESIKQQDLLKKTILLLNTDFATQKDQSYLAALDFITTVKKQMRMLTVEEIKLVHTALTSFAFEKYIKYRQEDERPKYSFLSLSGKTKCKAAEKWTSIRCGNPVRVGFFEKIALQQGRLGALTELLDEAQHEVLETHKAIANKQS